MHTFEKILFGAEVSKVCVLPESLLLVSGTSWYNTTTHHCTSTAREASRPAKAARPPPPLDHSTTEYCISMTFHYYSLFRTLAYEYLRTTGVRVRVSGETYVRTVPHTHVPPSSPRPFTKGRSMTERHPVIYMHSNYTSLS